MKKAWFWTSIVVLAAVLAACGDGGGNDAPGRPETTLPVPESPNACEEPPLVTGLPPEGNQLRNPSFEEGSEPWCSLATPGWGTPYTVSSSQVHSGEHSAFLQMRTTDETASFSSQVFGVLTEVQPEQFPEVLSGYYFVQRWDHNVRKQYLQAVVIVWGADNLEPQELPNHQIRYVLGPIDYEPLEITNAQYVILASRLFGGGRWIRFEANVREDFERLWGGVPEGYDRIRVLFEVRWDDRRAFDEYAAADVYYDDLYFGPAEGAP